ncbi:hypothetical protein QU38_00325, partial [Staphylococcus aureus]
VGRLLHQPADESDQARLARTLQPLGIQDGVDRAIALVGIVIDQHIVIAVPMAHFVGGARHAGVDHFGRVGGAVDQALMEFLERRRQDEPPHHVAAGELEQLLGALPVDVEQHVAARIEDRLDMRARGAVA